MRALRLMIVVTVACKHPGSYGDGVYTQPYPQSYLSTGLFGGTWVTQSQGQSTLTLQEQNGQVVGTLQSGSLQGSLQGVARGGQLDFTITLTDGSTGRFAAYGDGNQITMNIGRPQALVFVRSTAQPAQAGYTPTAPQPYPPPAAQPGAAPNPPAAEVPAFTAGPATGAPVWDQYKGWEVKTPPGWKHDVQQGQLVFGSPREAGVILVMFFAGITYEHASAALDGEIRKIGAVPAGRQRATTVKAGRAVIAELTGVINGEGVQGRAVGVAGPAGTLLTVGFSRPEAFQILRQRVDAIAQSTRFIAPERPPQRTPERTAATGERGQVGLVSGCFRTSAGGSAVWVERTLYFDGAGRFSKYSFVASHTTDAGGRLTGSSASSESRGDGGSYTVQNSKRVHLQWNDGTTASFDLVFEHGALGALQSGNTFYLRCR